LINCLRYNFAGEGNLWSLYRKVCCGSLWLETRTPQELTVKISHVKMHVPDDLCGITSQTTWISTIIAIRISNLEVIILGHDRIQCLCVQVQKVHNDNIYPITGGK